MSRPAWTRYLLYALVFLLLTGAFLILHFPEDRLAWMVNSSLQRTTGGLISVDSAGLTPTMALVLDGVSVAGDDGKVAVGSARIRINPLSNLGATRRIRFSLYGPWGQFPGSFRRSGGGWRLQGAGSGIRLSEFGPVASLPVRLDGELGLDLDLDVRRGADGRETASGEGELIIKDARVSGGIVDLLGEEGVSFVQVRSFLKVEDNLVTLGESRFTGDLLGDVKGTVQLVPENLQLSRMDLTVAVRPSVAERDRLGSLLTMLGGRQRADGSVVITLRGTFLNPVVNAS